MPLKQTTEVQTYMRKHNDTICVHAELKGSRPCSFTNKHVALHYEIATMV